MNGPQEAYDKAHHSAGGYCLNDPCQWHPFEQRLRPQPMHPQPEAATVEFEDGATLYDKYRRLQAEVERMRIGMEGAAENLARVEALADEWGADEGILNPASRHTRDVMLRELRAALGAEAAS